MRSLRPAVRREFIHALLRDLAQPMGVPNEYVVEYFSPSLDDYEVFHNVDVEGVDGPTQADAAGATVAAPPAATRA